MAEHAGICQLQGFAYQLSRLGALTWEKPSSPGRKDERGRGKGRSHTLLQPPPSPPPSLTHAHALPALTTHSHSSCLCPSDSMGRLPQRLLSLCLTGALLLPLCQGEDDSLTQPQLSSSIVQVPAFRSIPQREHHLTHFHCNEEEYNYDYEATATPDYDYNVTFDYIYLNNVSDVDYGLYEVQSKGNAVKGQSDIGVNNNNNKVRQ
ncbi:hypothetical protein JZ751_009869 [Albula glossodonta]|uniref:Uncharacterized protein n=1 Tax=Albula glossodonta TaxID=121402 RepID=A0A8T2NWF8_9TELE|nr:hypothetical protein JZ751_009869 [Albula glossodonta]